MAEASTCRPRGPYSVCSLPRTFTVFRQCAHEVRMKASTTGWPLYWLSVRGLPSAMWMVKSGALMRQIGRRNGRQEESKQRLDAGPDHGGRFDDGSVADGAGQPERWARAGPPFRPRLVARRQRVYRSTETARYCVLSNGRRGSRFGFCWNALYSRDDKVCCRPGSGPREYGIEVMGKPIVAFSGLPDN